MNHISSKWLRKVRWLVIIYCSNFLIFFLYFGIHYHRWGNYKWITPEISGVIILQIVYEAVVSLFIIKRWTYIPVNISFFFAFLETGLSLTNTNVYYSPYMAGVFVFLFAAGTLGWLFPAAESMLMLFFWVAGIAGTIKPYHVSRQFILLGLAEVIAIAIVAYAGYKFWSRYYDLSENDQLRLLDKRLKSRIKQSTIILNSIGDGVIVFDAKGAVDLINPPASAMTGYEVKEALHLDIRKLVQYSNADPNKADKSMPDLFEAALKHKKHITETVKLESSRVSRNLIVSLGISPIVIPPNNELVAGVAIIHDVTAEQEIEQQRSDFISTASHEMRTPLATIEGYLDLALDEKISHLDKNVRGYIESAHESTVHLGQLFQDLLTSSRAEEGRLSNHPELIEVGTFLNDLSEDFRYSTNTYGLAIELMVGTNEIIKSSQKASEPHLPKQKYYVDVDPDRLREVISNLFDNAIKYTEKGKVIIGLSGDSDTVQIYVKDTGTGIPNDDIPHLFQKFYRVDNSATRTIGGTGLGLFICRKIVELYGGRIWAESKLGEGSTFYIKLPRLSDQQVKDLKATKSKPALKRHHTAGSVSANRQLPV